ncbi:MAG TPA: hypothetical protein VEU96_19515 [Bryobacteraceae bacterium]|nr:hypothetical protein [Bryobacteraceae bacterium]
MLRSLWSALTAIMLVTALVGGDCVSCGTGGASSSGSGGCCSAQGHCRAPHKAPPAQCLKAHVDGALVEQAAQVQPDIVNFHAPQATEPVFQENASPAPSPTGYSPPDLCILNSALLV